MKRHTLRIVAPLLLCLPLASLPLCLLNGAAADDAPTAINAERSDPAPVADVPADVEAPEASPTPRRYAFREPDYSLRDHPLRAVPRTLGAAMPPAEDAIVLEWPIRWWSSHWSAPNNTSAAAMDMHDGHPRFRVMAPAKRKVWVKYLDLFVDTHRYPILAMTYRALNMDADSESYVLYLDDGSGPDYGGLMPVRQLDLISDGRVHTLSCDLRSMQPIGELIGLAVGVKAARQLDAPAQLELLDLRFESVEPQWPRQDQRSFHVQVRDSLGTAIETASVIVDAERRNWAQRFLTNAEGWAQVRLARASANERHMLRVEAEGKLPVELRDLLPNVEPIEVTLVDAAPYQGQVVDERGQPLANAIVRVGVARCSVAQSGLWTRTDTEAVSDAQGRWTTAPMAQAERLVHVELAHSDYGADEHSVEVPPMRVQDLLSGHAKLSIQPKLYTVTLRIRDEQGQAVHQRVAASSPAGEHLATSQHGQLDIQLKGHGPLLLLSDGYAPEVVMLPDNAGADEPVDVTLHRGQEMSLRLADNDGRPVVGARVRVLMWQGIPLASPRFSQTSDERGRVVYRVHGTPQVLVAVVREAGLEHYPVMLGQPEKTLKLQTPPVPAPHDDPSPNDGRRPGYDPERIFRRIS